MYGIGICSFSSRFDILYTSCTEHILKFIAHDGLIVHDSLKIMYENFMIFILVGILQLYCQNDSFCMNFFLLIYKESIAKTEGRMEWQMLTVIHFLIYKETVRPNATQIASFFGSVFKMKYLGLIVSRLCSAEVLLPDIVDL